VFPTTKTLPAGLPGSFTVQLQEGTHRGERQLWAPVSHDGHSYRLVISGQISGVRSVYPQAGETWDVWPDHSPNGHVVFCRPHRLMKDVSGVHPVLASLSPYVHPDYSVTVKSRGLRTTSYYSGKLKSASVEGGVFRVTITNMKAFRSYEPLPDLQIACDPEFVREKHKTNALFEFHMFGDGGTTYEISVNRN